MGNRIPYPGLEHLEQDEELSGRVLSQRSLKEHKGFAPATVIYASDFSWETPDSDPFPDGMAGVTFVKCHLHNVIVPPGNTVIDCFQTRYKCQNDGNDWIVDSKNNPTLPINHKIFTKLGLPIPKPEDIPLEKVVEAVDLIKVATIAKAELEAAAEGGK